MQSSDLRLVPCHLDYAQQTVNANLYTCIFNGPRPPVNRRARQPCYSNSGPKRRPGCDRCARSAIFRSAVFELGGVEEDKVGLEIFDGVEEDEVGLWMYSTASLHHAPKVTVSQRDHCGQKPTGNGPTTRSHRRLTSPFKCNRIHYSHGSRHLPSKLTGAL